MQSDGKESAYSNEVAGTPVENHAVAVPYIDGELKFFDMGRDVGFLDNRARDGYWYAYYTSNETALDGKPGVDVRRAKADIDSGTRFRWRCVIGLL